VLFIFRASCRFAGHKDGPNVSSEPIAPRDKALEVNLDHRYYGTFAE
jgi:hypothetical protein